MQTACAPSSHAFVRRIPRGKTGNADPVNLLRRMAEKNLRRIRGMIRNARCREERTELKALRHRLVEIATLMAECPWEAPVETHQEIAGAMSEARRIYARAPKSDDRPRAKRPPQKKRVQAKKGRLSNVASEVAGEGDEVDLEAAQQDAIAHLRPSPDRKDPRAYSLEDEFGPQRNPPQE